MSREPCHSSIRVNFEYALKFRRGLSAQGHDSFQMIKTDIPEKVFRSFLILMFFYLLAVFSPTCFY
jgi:hypothetical protein